MRHVLLNCSLAVLLVACGGDADETARAGSETTGPPQGAAPAPVSATSPAAPAAEALNPSMISGNAEPPADAAPPAPTSDIAAGQMVYEAKCAGCHGADGKKVTGAVTLASAATQSKSDDELARAIGEGAGKMSAAAHKRAGLNVEQINNVVAYIKALK